MLTRFALAALLAAFGPVAVAAEHWVFLGTVTESGGSRGIYRCKFDDVTGKITEPQLAAEMGSPTALAVHPNGRFLYAAGASDDKDGGPVVGFAIDNLTGKLTKLNEHASGGAGPCFVSVHPDGRYLIVANSSGSTAVFQLDEAGKIVVRTALVRDEGSGPVKGQQDRPRPLCAAFTPKGDRAITADLGIDRLKVFAFDGRKGALTDETQKDVTAVPGSGPRHFAFGRGGEFLYFCGELDSTVNVVHFGPGGGATVQSLGTAPVSAKGNAPAECLISNTGRFVYVSNRGHNSVAVFRVGMDGKLTPGGYITGDIKTPAGVALDPSGKWMLVASRDGGRAGVWQLDAASGGGKETGAAVKVAKCVCVRFVPIRGTR
jgi:6-phosphogluconolactonase